jgi:hypothetical protein
MSTIIYCHAYYSFSKAFKIILTVLTTIAPPKADQNPIIIKPLSNEDVKPKIIAFITKVNNPRVSIFNGRVKTIRIGLIEIFNNPNIIDAISKSPKSLKKIPGKIKLAAPSDKEFINQRITAFLNKTISYI